MKLILALLLLVLGVLGTDVPLVLDGALIDATVTDNTYNSGGTISVNGWVVTIPQNLLVTFPAAFIPWPEFVAGKAAVLGFEVNVAGNIVDGRAIAAQVIISEFAMELNQGFIEELSFDGIIKIRNGPNIRINDPNAVFSAGFSAPFMVADDKNPSVTAFSGFPMCVPRSTNDTLCPLSNRPLVTGSTAPRRIFQAPDALVMAPFMVGDFIEYRGYRTAANTMVVFEIVAWNVQITTVGAPTYIRLEAALIGIYSADPNGEVAETRFVGFTSDSTATVSINAIDINPCTGVETERPISVGQPRLDARNKFLARIDGTVPVAYTREYRAVASTGIVTTRNGIRAGQYAAPILEWIQPELTAPGNEPLIHEFSQLTHLTQGIGPVENGDVFGPLDPFPQTGVQVFNLTTCPPIIPVNATIPQTPAPALEASINIGASGSTAKVTDKLLVQASDTFTLAGTQTNPAAALTDDILLWTWSILPTIATGTPTTALQTFTTSPTNNTLTAKFAPSAAAGDYTFQLTITSPSQNTTGTSTITITFFSGADTVAVKAVTWTSAQSGTVGITCTSSYLVDAKVGMAVTYPGDKGVTTAAMAATPPGSGAWSFSARKVDQPGTVTCVSLLGGSATRSGLTTRDGTVGGQRGGAAVRWGRRGGQ
ncbi:hypothetical protein B0T22DRAFT_418518 [Podospora appendiculata]|uniref:Uncharacterized protein n=1 Tax=Podospora appendiculata TaxID=314037 RepID=A0AAE0XLH8_9PEZI|nr:hypothetical protein B0T22DRAFT_418518 [Podospora appendiculata]